MDSNVVLSVSEALGGFNWRRRCRKGEGKGCGLLGLMEARFDSILSRLGQSGVAVISVVFAGELDVRELRSS